MKCFVTGGAGFIGSHLVDELIAEGNEVIAYDNFSTGKLENISSHRKNKKFKLIKGNVVNKKLLQKSMKDCDVVFHMSANADVRYGLKHPWRDVEQNTIATWNVLEAMRYNDIKNIIFPSTGSIYGEPEIFPTPEEAPFPVQTSLYGASKLACEGMIQAYCEGYGMKSCIFRFVSIMGERYSHGCVVDFYHKLQKNKFSLEILGNGKQNKSYLYVVDCVDAMLLAFSKSKENVNIFNLGTKETMIVDDIARIVISQLGIKNVKLMHTGGIRGWIGDSPYIFLDTKKINRLGWYPKFTVEESVIKTINYLKESR